MTASDDAPPAPGLVLAELHRSPNPAVLSAPGLVLAELHRSPNPAQR